MVQHSRSMAEQL